MARPGISADRLWARLMALGEDGALPGGGVNRQALSEEEILAWRRIIGWASEAGLVPSTDAAGNLFLTLEGSVPHLAPVVAGSHIDSQPTGGLFDGAFGTLAALEAATAIAEAGLVPERSIVVVGWMNEEGSRFAPGMMGSELFAGLRTLEDVMAVRDADGIGVGEALKRVHDCFPDIGRRPLGFPIHSYIEPHIEQADFLGTAGAVIGVVSGIQGKKTFEVTVTGREAHAGTEPMERRQDAVQAFARMATRMHDAMAGDDRVKFTIGRVVVEPNAPSVVPARVTFRIDLRHPDNAALGAFGAQLEAIALAEAGACEVDIRRLVDAPSNGFDEGLRAAIRASADRHGLRSLDVLSAAGHDARQMAPLTRSAMIFIPCRGGISHHPDEWAEPAHVAAGAAVLLDLLLQEAGVPYNQGDA
ncbi:hydantoinase/carbamoylase family amidase [Rhizobium sp. TRM96647]|uniref:hydantoinase/carbamoylase family amidase n=1 Tax=unclassified Rhizobium TaxID=2613769 RepID=UPI0021E72076|nr:MULTISPECIES: hydantoinase/carbamoylase family amidase [unclassified Rhizobium]MCV3736153.1 hydantoinase/carbamoylase family amidase [Rhizobium sp. TRM96647]MCV3758185.1 hydantoinase/carbamoylase family amidase [Rhizobium sp. TRM96650]